MAAPNSPPMARPCRRQKAAHARGGSTGLQRACGSRLTPPPPHLEHAQDAEQNGGRLARCVRAQIIGGQRPVRRAAGAAGMMTGAPIAQQDAPHPQPPCALPHPPHPISMVDTAINTIPTMSAVERPRVSPRWPKSRAPTGRAACSGGAARRGQRRRRHRLTGKTIANCSPKQKMGCTHHCLQREGRAARNRAQSERAHAGENRYGAAPLRLAAARGRRPANAAPEHQTKGSPARRLPSRRCRT